MKLSDLTMSHLASQVTVILRVSLLTLFLFPESIVLCLRPPVPLSALQALPVSLQIFLSS